MDDTIKCIKLANWNNLVYWFTYWHHIHNLHNYWFWQSYLQQHSYGSATHEDLWDALDATMVSDGRLRVEWRDGRWLHMCRDVIALPHILVMAHVLTVCDRQVLNLASINWISPRQIGILPLKSQPQSNTRWFSCRLKVTMTVRYILLKIWVTLVSPLFGGRKTWRTEVS